MGLGIFDEQQPINAYVSIVAADTTTYKTLASALGHVVRFDGLYVRNTDGISHVIQLHQGVGGVYQLIGTATIPGTADSVAQVPVELLAQLGMVPQGGIVLGPTDQLAVSLAVTVI